jgi:hypothetical protein
MPKRTLILILVLIIVTVGLVWLSVYTVPGQKTTPIAKTPTVLPFAKTTITLSSSPTATFTNPDVYVLDSMISTEDNKITAVQLELSYDPKALTKVDILPGTFFKDPVVLLKNIDEKNGRISYAIAIKMGQQAVGGTGTIAQIQFSPLPGSNLTTTSISFLPKTKVSAQGEAKTVLKSALGTTIDLLKLTPTTTSTSSPNTIGE